MAIISRYDVEKIIRANAPSKMRVDEEATEVLVELLEKKAAEIVSKAVFIAMTAKDLRRRKTKKAKLTRLDIEIAASGG